MDERRRKNRRLLTYFSRVLDRNNGRLLGYLVDMTSDGVMIVGNIPLRINSNFQLRIDLPENYAEKEQLDFEAKAIWNMPDPDPELFRTGLELIGVNQSDRTILERLIVEYGLNREV
jgi:hypothetical protein